MTTHQQQREAVERRRLGMTVAEAKAAFADLAKAGTTVAEQMAAWREAYGRPLAQSESRATEDRP